MALEKDGSGSWRAAAASEAAAAAVAAVDAHGTYSHEVQRREMQEADLFMDAFDRNEAGTFPWPPAPQAP